MSKMRSKLPQAKSILILPTDAGIDLQATAEKMVKNKRCLDYLKAVTGITNEENLIEEFLEQKSRIAIYSCYAFCKYDPDLLVPNEYKILKYVFDAINLKDIDIITDNFDTIALLFNKVKDKELTNQELGNVLMSVIQNKELKPMLENLLETVLNAKLIKIEGIDEGVTKEEAIKETIENLEIEDLKALYYFVKASIGLNIEKKTILPS